MGKTDQVERVIALRGTDDSHVAARLLTRVWDRSGFIFMPTRKGQAWEENCWGWVVPSDHVVPTASSAADQYWCPLVFSEAHRKAQYALPTRVLWADLDAADPRGVRLKPSCAWETSGGDMLPGCDHKIAGYCVVCEREVTPHYQALWFLDTEVTAQEAAALSKRIAYAEPGCDRSGWDVTQVLRLPGTLNHKYDPPQPVRFLWATKHAYTIAEVEAAYPQERQPQPMTTADFPTYKTPELAELERHIRLPVGVQYELEKPYDGRDRSAWLFRTAQLLLHFDVPPAVIVELLRRTAMNKFRGRDDETKQLRQTVTDAMNKRGVRADD